MMTMTMTPKVKYWIFLLGITLILFGVILGAFYSSWILLDAEEQALVGELSGKLLRFPILAAFVLVFLIGGMVSLLFRHYIIPILQLGEETRLISVANPGYRIKPRGAKELQHLTAIINESAVAFEVLQAEVKAKIDRARAQLHAERNRLAALMTELPNGVLVCNKDGQVLLYNPQAQKLLQQPDKLIGLGRSVFAVLDREAIVHALSTLQQNVANEQQHPVTTFMLSIRDGLCLRIIMAPVFTEGDIREISGFVLTLENMTHQLDLELRRDYMMQTLTEAMRFSTQEIREAISSILRRPDMSPEELGARRKVIDRASLAIEDQLEQARSEYLQSILGETTIDEVLGDYLIEMLSRQFRGRLRVDVHTQVDPELWFRVDSFALTQGLAQLASCLQSCSPLTGVKLALAARGEREAELSILWINCLLAEETVRDWQSRPLISDARGRLVSIGELLTNSGGTIDILLDEAASCRGVCITLPQAVHDSGRVTAGRGPEQRPVNYEFDLFQAETWKEYGQRPLRKLTFVVFDTETTGLNPSQGDEIIQIGAVRIVNGRILYNENIDQLVDPQRHVPAQSVAVHGIPPEALRGQPTIDKVLPIFHHFCEDSVLIAHNAAFDMRLLELKEELTGIKFDHPVLDTMLLGWAVQPNQDSQSLDEMARRLNVEVIGRHTALGDALVTAEIFVRLLPLLEERGIFTLEDAMQASLKSPLARLTY